MTPKERIYATMRGEAKDRPAVTPMFMARAAGFLVPRIELSGVQNHVNLGVTLAAAGQEEQAVAHLRRAIEMDPESRHAHYLLGTILCKLGALQLQRRELAGAEVHFRQALEVNADLTDAHYGLGLACYEQNRLEEAGESFRRALMIDPNRADILNDLGVSCGQLGMLDRAEACYRSAIAASSMLL